MADDNKQVHIQVLKKVMKYLQSISFNSSPPEISREVHYIIRKTTHSKDPYKRVKDQANNTAKNFFPYLKKLVKESDDSLLMAVKLAIVGNVIDFGTTNRFNIDEMINAAVRTEEIDDEAYDQFVKSLMETKEILYIADNCGEIFFDKLLLEELTEQKKKITYVVRANPIINDATIDDAKFAGIDRFAEVIAGDAGNDRSAPGMVMSYASPLFLQHLQSADMVIAKGQGNYEALSDVKREIFFLLVVKCPLVAKDIGNEIGKLVLKVKKR